MSDFECNCKKCNGESPEYREEHKDNCTCAECYKYHANEHDSREYGVWCVWCQEDLLEEADRIMQEENFQNDL